MIPALLIAYACTVPDRGGVRPFVVEASRDAVQIEQMEPTGAPIQFFGAFRPGFSVDARFCKKTRTTTFLRTGLPKIATLTRATSSLGTAGGYECWSAATITIQARVSYDTRKRIRQAVVAVRAGPKNRPVAFSIVTPTKQNVIWLSAGACHER